MNYDKFNIGISNKSFYRTKIKINNCNIYILTYGKNGIHIKRRNINFQILSS